MMNPDGKMTDTQILDQFDKYWDNNYSYVSKEYPNSMVIKYARQTNSISAAANLIYDWSLANGDADVQE